MTSATNNDSQGIYTVRVGHWRRTSLNPRLKRIQIIPCYIRYCKQSFSSVEIIVTFWKLWIIFLMHVIFLKLTFHIKYCVLTFLLWISELLSFLAARNWPLDQSRRKISTVKIKEERPPNSNLLKFGVQIVGKKEFARMGNPHLSIVLLNFLHSFYFFRIITMSRRHIFFMLSCTHLFRESTRLILLAALGF